MWLLAGPIKCNWPSVTLWSVFQYPVTIIVGAIFRKCDSWRAVMKYVLLLLFQAHSKGSQSEWVLFHNIHLSWMKWKIILSGRLYILFTYSNLKCIVVSTAACAPVNHALNKTSPGTVSFFICHASICEFFFYKDKFPD